ncbi:MAG: hypothetical protein U5K32_12285 [Bacteroidales bacterium]|nr:hypothetical protein [Bacteroidales bacterium]
MVLITKNVLRLIILFSLCCMAACEDMYFVNCSECETTEPTRCNLRIELAYTGTPWDVTIYRGSIESGVVISDTAINNSFYHEVSLNSEYTVKATAVINGTEYTAIDSTRPRVKVITDVCEETCYWVVNRTVKLDIKYY